MRGRTSPPVKLVRFHAVRREPSSGAYRLSEEGRDVVLEPDAGAVVLAVAIARAIADGAALRREIVVLAIGPRLLTLGMAFARLVVAVAMLGAIITVAMAGLLVAMRAVVAGVAFLTRAVVTLAVIAGTVVAAMAMVAVVAARAILAAGTVAVFR